MSDELRIEIIPPGPITWPSGVLIEPWHTEDPGIEAPGAVIVVERIDEFLRGYGADLRIRNAVEAAAPDGVIRMTAGDDGVKVEVISPEEFYLPPSDRS